MEIEKEEYCYRSTGGLNQMRIFDTDIVGSMDLSSKRTEVLHQASTFKIRIIILPPGGIISPCMMTATVIFHVISGAVDITSDGEMVSIKEGQGVVSEPATISMVSTNGVKLLGIQIETSKAKTNE
jgi:mannose-6-phosphate isomerase-like protein (cupin superfamily)